MRPLFVLVAIAGLIAILKTPSDYLQITGDVKLLEAPTELARSSSTELVHLLVVIRRI